MVEICLININEPCPFCGQNPPIGGTIPDSSEGAKSGEEKPCPVCLPCICNYECEGCGNRAGCTTCYGDYASDRYRIDDDDELPLDYERCGDCGFDHDYEYPAAVDWHLKNPGSYGINSPISKNAARETLISLLEVMTDDDESKCRHLVKRIEHR